MQRLKTIEKAACRLTACLQMVLLAVEAIALGVTQLALTACFAVNHARATLMRLPVFLSRLCHASTAVSQRMNGRLRGGIAVGIAWCTCMRSWLLQEKG